MKYFLYLLVWITCLPFITTLLLCKELYRAITKQPRMTELEFMMWAQASFPKIFWFGFGFYFCLTILIYVLRY